jgi:predicted short-subunit dehydrogenase-like oxidoreductase (DUF2520 family)
MKISIIGAGRVGQTIGRLAREAGYEVGEVVCRSRRSAAAARRFIGAGEPQEASRARLSAADLLLIATGDDHISDAVGTVLGSVAALGRPVALHTSGALSSDVLGPLRAAGLATGSCHPLQTFESPRRALALVEKTYFCIEGEARAVRAARRLARDIGARHFEIPTRKKALYHAAAVMASGGVVALVSRSLEMLADCGLTEAESKRVLLPLVEGTVANVREIGAARALTGPVRRGDAGTVARNIGAVTKFDSGWAIAYIILAEQAVALAEQAGTDKKRLAELRRLLTGSGRKR